MTKRRENCFFYILLFGVLVSELFCYMFSAYHYNSINDFLLITFIISVVYCLTKLFDKFKSTFALFSMLVSITTIVLVVFGIPQFRGFLKIAEMHGFELSDINEIRYWFQPYQLRTNEWNSLLIVILPFPILGALFYKDWRLVYSLFIGIILFALLVSGSRGAFLSLLSFFALALLLVLIYIRPIKSTLLKVSLFFSPAFLLCLVLIYPHHSTLNRVNPLSANKTESMTRSSQGRVKLWKHSINLIKKNPFIGIGQKNFALFANANQTDNQAFVAKINNSFLEIIIEKGLLGFLMYAFLFLLTGWKTFSKIRNSKLASKKAINIILFSSLIAILIRQLTYSSTFHQPVEFFLLIILLFMSAEPNSGVNKTKASNWVYLVLAAFLSFVFIKFKSFNQSKTYIEQAIEKMEEGEKEAAMLKLKKVPLKHQDFVMYQLVNTNLIASEKLPLNWENNLTKKQEHIISDLIEQLEVANHSSHYTDDLVAHNLGYLYFLNNDERNAEKHFIHATKLRPTIGIYQLSLGHYYDQIGKSDKALKSYAKAIFISPEILLSPFMKDLEKRDTVSFPLVQSMLLDSLSNNDSIDPIYQAKKASILLSLGKTENAATILEGLSERLPNLNRVWYNLALCRKKQSRFLEAKTSLRKSIFLNPSDYLPFTLLAQLEENNNRKAAIAYYKRTLFIYLNLHTDHFAQAKYLYASNSLRNGILPNGWLYYCKPYIDVVDVLSQLSKLLLLEGKIEEAHYFKNLKKGINSLKPEDIIKKIPKTKSNNNISKEVLEVFENQYPEFVNSNPTQTKLLFKTRHLDDFELLLLDTLTNEFKSLDKSSYTQLSLTWHPDGEKLYYQQYNEQIRAYDLWSIDIHNKTKQKINCPPSTSAIPPLRWSASGRYLAYLNTGQVNELWIYDSKEKRETKISTTVDPYTDFNWQADSVLWYFQSPHQGIVVSYNMKNKTQKNYDIFRGAEIKTIDIQKDKIYTILRLPLEEYYQLFSYNLTTKSVEKLSNEPFNVTSFVPIGDEIFSYTYNKDGLLKLKYLDKITPPNLASEYALGGISTGKNRNTILRMETINQPSQAQFLNFKTGYSKILYKPKNTGKYIIPQISLIENENEEQSVIPVITWNPSDSIKKMRKKAIIYIHGGPHIQSKPVWDAKIQALVKAGFYFVAVNYSGSTGYTKSYESIENPKQQVKDVLKTVEKAIIREDMTNKDIILMASSYGGTLVFDVAKKMDNLGGIILISAALPPNLTRPASLEQDKLHAFYGSNDPLIFNAYSMVERGTISETAFHVFEAEGHFFHRTSTWASICQEVIASYQ